ncbi:MAG: biopolymer transporter ExbD [Leptospira sp.]|nr:biopolymer transporter ExbD [Leptospira sp.]
MNRKHRKRHTPASIIDITSFLDIIFILLIFVMISVSFSKDYKFLEMDLPASRQGQSVDSIDLTLSLRSDGKFLLDKKNISFEDIDKLATSKRLENKIVILNVEKAVPFERFIRTVEILKKGRIKRLNLGIKEGE